MCALVGMLMQAGVQSDRQPGAIPGSDIDLGALRHALWSKRSLILGLTLVAAAIAFVAVNLITPRYKSEARVLVEMRENIFFRPDAEKMSERVTTVDQEAVTSQVQLILSRDLAREVIKKLNLGEKPEFDPVLRSASLWRGVFSLTGIVKDPLGMTHEERVYRSYYERLSAFQVEKTRVIAIEFESQTARCPGSQLRCRYVSAVPAGCEAGPDPRSRDVAVRGNREAAYKSGAGGDQGRTIPFQDQPFHRQQQHDAFQPAARGLQRPTCCRARTKGGRRGKGEAHSQCAEGRHAD